MTEVELQSLVELHWEKLVRIVKGSLRIQRYDAEDIVQKTLERIWRRGSICADPRAYEKWLVAAVLNSGIDWWRAKGSYGRCRDGYYRARKLGDRGTTIEPKEGRKKTLRPPIF